MNYSGKRVLCTGGSGFVGTNLVERLVEAGARVTVIDDLSTGTNHYYYRNDIGFVNASVASKVSIDSLFENANFDIIFHLAARNIIASTKDPRSDFETNIGGTLNLLMTARKHEVERFVYTSSASVYGNPKHLPINEDDGINLLTPYAVSKFAGEGYCMAFHESYGVPVAVLRLSNVYGTYQSPQNPYCGVVAKMMQRVMDGADVVVHSGGMQTRDFTYVDDVVDALLLAGISPRAVGEVFNIATGVETSVNDLAKMIISIAGPQYDQTLLYNHAVDVYPRIAYVDRRDIDNISRRVLNTEKARSKLGWIAKTRLDNGLRLTKEWLDGNK